MKVFSVESSNIDAHGKLFVCLCKTHEGAMNKAVSECNVAIEDYNDAYECKQQEDMVYISLKKFNAPIEVWRVREHEVIEENS